MLVPREGHCQALPVCSKSRNYIYHWAVIGCTMICLLMEKLHVRAVITATNLIGLGDLILQSY